MSPRETEKMERELLKNEQLIDKLIEQIGDISGQLRFPMPDQKKQLLLGRLNKVKEDKVRLEMVGEKIAISLCAG
ncbi:MAG: hypothetical protein NTZ80_04205 [Patescibacteria group bacterium]|nr:hypothetical protein [Patescibacteria group bacterium]